MNPLARISAKDVTFFLSPALMIDDQWVEAFGKPVEERVRRIPFDLLYLTAKFEIVPKWLLRDFVCVSCDICPEVADQRIEEALALGMITDLTPDGDKRQRLYGFTEGQLTKLRRIQKGTIMAYQMALIQGQNPENPTHGRTEQNQSWYRNALDKVSAKGEKYDEVIARLKSVRHLLMILLFAIALCFVSMETALATFSAGTGKY